MLKGTLVVVVVAALAKRTRRGRRANGGCWRGRQDECILVVSLTAIEAMVIFHAVSCNFGTVVIAKSQ